MFAIKCKQFLVANALDASLLSNPGFELKFASEFPQLMQICYQMPDLIANLHQAISERARQ